MTQEQRINSEIEAASKRIDAAYADDPRGRIDAYCLDRGPLSQRFPCGVASILLPVHQCVRKPPCVTPSTT